MGQAWPAPICVGGGGTNVAALLRWLEVNGETFANRGGVVGSTLGFRLAAHYYSLR